MDLAYYLWTNRIKQKDFAAQIGVNVMTLNNVLHGRRQPSLEVASKIIEGTNGEVTLNDLLHPKLDRQKIKN